MRTTVDLDRPLLERAKRRAAQRRTTLSVVVREAVAAYLSRPAATEEELFELLTGGEPGGYAPTPAEMAAATEQDDTIALRGAALPSTGRPSRRGHA